jgi:hypothetical protein
MIHKKRSGFLTLLMIIAINGSAIDSLRVNTFNTYRLLELDNPWLNSGNASGLAFNSIKSWAEFDAGTDFKKGDFHRIREAGDLNHYFFNTRSLKSFNNKFFLEGTFSYHYLDEKGARWNGIYDPYMGNPYILGDSLTGTTFHKESYELSGKIAYKRSEKLIIGAGIDYYARVGAKQKDPRPKTITSYIGFHPSVILCRDNYNLGFDLGFSNREEQIEYETKRSNFTPVFFMFKGFGFFSKEIDYGFTRFQSSHDLTGGIQYEKKKGKGRSLTGLRLDYGLEEVTDGSSVVKKEDGGEWEKIHAGVNHFLTKRTGNIMHSLEGKFDFFGGYGKEFLQDVIFVGNREEYITISKNLKFKRLKMTGELSYNFLKLQEHNRIDWDVQTNINLDNTSEKYYYIPEVFTSSYFNVTGNVLIQKNIYLSNIHIAPGLNGAYNYNISNSLFISDLAEIRNTQRTDVYAHEFGYYCADYLKIGGNCRVGLTPGIVRSLNQIYFEMKVDYVKPIDLEDYFFSFGFKLSFVF